MDDFIQDFQRRLAGGEIELQPLIQGGKGSGNFGHSGIPGKVGGSGTGGTGKGKDYPKPTSHEKLTIDRAVSLFKNRGITFDPSSSNSSAGKTTYMVKDKAGTKKRMSAEDMDKFLRSDEDMI